MNEMQLTMTAQDFATPSRSCEASTKAQKSNQLKPSSPVALMVEMYRGNRWEIPIWIALAISATVLLALSFKI